MMTNDLFKYFIQEKDIILIDSKNEIPREVNYMPESIVPWTVTEKK
ncbi:hypothetical protein EA79_02784 [Enterococcus faecalis]|nr:hypothetical protein EA79_02784 [Enterococcus faecalis]